MGVSHIYEKTTTYKEIIQRLEVRTVKMENFKLQILAFQLIVDLLSFM